METATKNNHIGKKISRIRELRGKKQEALAIELGISQQSVSNIEQSETIDDEKLKEIASALGVSPEAIKNFSDDAIFNYFSNFYDNSTGQVYNSNCTFNPLDKLMDAYEENKKLYERLLQAEKDKIEYLEKILNK